MRAGSSRRHLFRLACTLALAGIVGRGTPATILEGTPAWDANHFEPRPTISIRGRIQTLRIYGPRDGDPIVVSSGDGGWIHLAPHVAQLLGSKGYFVLGFDVRSYLSSFTSVTTTLRAEDVPGDYGALAEAAWRSTGRKPILIGVSEGAGLSVLAATEPPARAAIAGVIGIGLPDVNELGWRWSDAVIYFTHGAPKEPSFSTAAVVRKVAPLPVAAIHSLRDEFASIAEVSRILQQAGEPKKLWTVQASNHGFTDNRLEFDRRLLEAVAWVQQHTPPEQPAETDSLK